MKGKYRKDFTGTCTFKQKGINNMRECGMLLPIASLPSKYGIGCFSKEAYEFVDQLKEGGQSFWQILPLGPTGFGDSPYQAFSAFAGNPYFIDLEQLVGEGLLTEDECEEADFGDDDRYIAYDKIYKARFKVLKKAYERWKKDHHQFIKSKLDPETIEYCFYMAVKDHFKSASWNKWDKDIRLRKPAAVEKYKKMLADEIGFYEFQQFEFNEQWSRLKAYANENHSTSNYDAYKFTYGSMFSHTATNSQLRQLYVDEHFCYVYII